MSIAITRATEETVADTTIAVLGLGCSTEKIELNVNRPHTTSDALPVPDVDKPPPLDEPVTDAVLKIVTSIIRHFYDTILTLYECFARSNVG